MHFTVFTPVQMASDLIAAVNSSDPLVLEKLVIAKLKLAGVSSSDAAGVQTSPLSLVGFDSIDGQILNGLLNYDTLNGTFALHVESASTDKVALAAEAAVQDYLSASWQSSIRLSLGPHVRLFDVRKTRMFLHLSSTT